MAEQSLPPPPRETWDFGAFTEYLLEEDRLYFCLVYEYAKEASSVRSAFETAKRSRKQFDKHGNWHYLFSPFPSGPIDPSTEISYLSLVAPPGFPKKPYLRCKHVLKVNPYAPPPPFELTASKQKRLAFFANNKLAPVYRLQKKSKNVYVPVVVPDSEFRPDKKDLEFEVDLTAPEGEAAHAFKEWFRSVKPSTKKPKRRRVDTYHFNHLRCLGAWRLQNHFETVAEAMEYSAEVRKQHGQSKVALYTDPGEWSRAAGKAQKLIDSLEVHIATAVTVE